MIDAQIDAQTTYPLSLLRCLVSSVSYLHFPRSYVHLLEKVQCCCEDRRPKFVIDIFYSLLEAQDWQRDVEVSGTSSQAPRHALIGLAFYVFNVLIVPRFGANFIMYFQACALGVLGTI